MDVMVIYKIINLINSKIYVGKDKHNKPKYLGSGKLLKLAITKYGKQSFKKEILQECGNEAELNTAEIYWIKKLKSRKRGIGYNIAEGGSGGKTMESPWNKGLKLGPLSEEQKEKQSKATKHGYETGGLINGMVGKTPWNKGIEMTVEAKEKSSKTHKSKKLSKETKEKISKANKGRKPYEMTDIIRERIQRSSLGKKASKQTRENMSNARNGDKSCAGPIVTCPHCGKVGANNGMRRWHFNKCREKTYG